MEPVPETERLEAFRPSLRVAPDATPPTPRRGPDAGPDAPSTSSVPPAASPTAAALPYRPRTASPLSAGPHARSRSVASLALPMSRTQSMPGVSGSGRILYSPQLRPASPLGSPARVRAPRRPVDEAFPVSAPVRSSVLDADRGVSPGRPPASAPSPLARLRRPSSPLRSVAHASSLPLLPSTLSSGSSASSLRAYDALAAAPHAASLSSVPSTPTSARSRSPSISSLETIPDSPDAEEAALEAERLARLQAADDAADSSDSKSRSPADVPVRGRTMSFGSRDKRKRWSVCGAERRGDIDLETIWED